MTLSEAARALWAKSPKGGDDWHPLIAHLLDVAACAWAILEREPTSTRALYAADLGLDESQALAWVCALAGLHDLGKASPAFQQKWPEGCNQVQEAGLSWPAGWTPRDVPHGVITHFTLPILLREHGWPGKPAQQIADAVGAHHGFRAREKEI
jgi:CRISPR-associated endonuclease/helicase Cas3